MATAKTKLSIQDQFRVKCIVAFHYFMWTWGTWITVMGVSFYFSKITAALAALYLVYIFLVQGNRALHAHVYTPIGRSWRGWKKVAEYFPAQLHKTADLDPASNYLFACHPHGITSWSSWLAFATEGTGFGELFPGIKMHVLTLTTNLRMPFLREYLLLHGLSDVSRGTCIKILKSGKGQSIMLAVGGATESLYAAPGTMNLVLHKRKGFVRVALQAGAALVPVINFGENETYSTWVAPPKSPLRKFQRWMEHSVGITMPFFWGDGFTLGFLPSFGLLPKQVPLNTVVGRPIQVPRFGGDIKSEEGSQLVDEYHSRYITALQDLWNANKGKYAVEDTSEFKLVE